MLISEEVCHVSVYIRFITKTSVDKPLLEYMSKTLNTR